MGARIEPWGTPQESSAGIEEKLPNLTEKHQLARGHASQHEAHEPVSAGQTY